MLHLGRRRNINEFAGAYGHDLTFDEYRWLALWLLIRGCNMLSPHAFYYSIRGPRIDERPRDVGPNSPWWNHYTGFAEMTGKLCWLNTDSEQICNIAVLGQDCRLPWETARVCFENQIDFNYLDERHLENGAGVNKDGIRIGSMQYSLLIIEDGYGPAAGSKAEAEIAQLAETDQIITWRPDDGAHSLLQRISRIIPASVSVTPACPGLRIRRVRKEGNDYLIVFNEGESSFRGQLHAEQENSGSRIDMDTGETLPWNSSTEVHLKPHDCIVLVWESTKQEMKPSKQAEDLQP